MERPALTTKSQVLLEIDHRGPRKSIVFRQYNEDDPIAIKYEYRMDEQAWDNMENPAVITVTIQPGDLLNMDNS